MTPLFKKLNLKDQKEILILNAPDSFESELEALEEIMVQRDLGKVQTITFSLAFVTKQVEVDELTRAIASKTKGDAIVWFAYPKGTSKKYKCEFNRDTGWAALGESGFEGVRQVAIDADWSALRFRKVEYISSMTRDEKRAITEKGKAKVKE